jgi:hypothetical protein
VDSLKRGQKPTRNLLVAKRLLIAALPSSAICCSFLQLLAEGASSLSPECGIEKLCPLLKRFASLIGMRKSKAELSGRFQRSYSESLAIGPTLDRKSLGTERSSTEKLSTGRSAVMEIGYQRANMLVCNNLEWNAQLFVSFIELLDDCGRKPNAVEPSLTSEDYSNSFLQEPRRSWER